MIDQIRQPADDSPASEGNYLLCTLLEAYRKSNPEQFCHGGQVYEFIISISPNKTLADELATAPLKHLLDEILPLVIEYTRPQLHEIYSQYKNVPAQSRIAFKAMCEYGWFPDYKMPYTDICSVGHLFRSGKLTEAEEELAVHFERRLDSIEHEIGESFNDRRIIIKSAFSAHRAGQFDLSVPVLLAQFDGVCKEFFGCCFFERKKWQRDVVTPYLSVEKDDFLDVLAFPLVLTLPMCASEKERGGENVAFNRHAILHGESLDYGTKENSLKAISLLCYISSVLRKNSPKDYEIFYSKGFVSKVEED